LGLALANVGTQPSSGPLKFLARQALTNSISQQKPMSAIPPKADIALHRSECPLCANSGHQFGLELEGASTLLRTP
jgi:hypothetical protein